MQDQDKLQNKLQDARRLLMSGAIAIPLFVLLAGCSSEFIGKQIVQASPTGDLALVDEINNGDSTELPSETDGPIKEDTLGGTTPSNTEMAGTSATCSWKPSLPAYFVATSGSDNNDGSETKPLKTLGQAVYRARTTGTKRIYVRAGTYFVNDPIEMNSGHNGIRINSYPCERATFDGGRKITNWTSRGGNVYSATINDATSYTDLTGYGVRQRFATSGAFDPAQPEISSWQYIDTNVKDSSGNIRLDAFKFRSGDLKQSDLPNLTGIVSVNFGWSRQRDSWVSVKSIDWTNRIVYLTASMYEKPDAGTFRLINNYRWIRRSGEFAWDWGSTKTLYTRQDNSTFKDNVYLPMLDTFIRIDGGTDIQILNLNFQNSISKGNAIEVKNSSKIMIGGNNFKIIGTGIKFEKVTDSSIAGNRIEQVAATAIDMYLGVNKNKIYGNRIKNFGQIYKYTAGISFAGAADNLITQNDVSEGARYGISQKDWSAETINWRNRIEYNWVYNTCKETGDGGAIETLGRQQNNTGTVIKGNIVDTYNGLGGSPLQKGFKGFGIYLDDKSSGMTIESNLIKNPAYAYAMVYIHGGDNNVVRYNYGIGGDPFNKFIRLEHTFNGTNSAGQTLYDLPKNSRVERNIVYYSAYNGDYSWYGGGGDAVVNYNLLVNTARYNESGQLLDANSIVTKTSPFVDVAKNNFTLKSGSEASKLGIPNLEINKIGASNYQPTSTLPRFW